MNNKEYSADIAGQLSELRDLLIVIERGGDKSPDVLYKLAIEKSRQITYLVSRWRDEANPMPVEVPAEYALWLDGKTEEEVADLSLENESQNSELDLSADFFTIEEKQAPIETIGERVDSEAEDNEVGNEAFEAVPIEIAIEADADIAEPVGDVEVTENKSDVSENESDVSENESDVSVMPSTDDLPVIEISNEMPIAEVGIADDKQGETEEMLAEAEPASFVEDAMDEQYFYIMGETLDSESSPETPFTVVEMMSVRRAKEMRRALSLNDRFRFRRELFGNSDVRMTETLALLDTMDGYAEAREYLTEDLGWDAEEPVVQEFLALVENHFKS